MEEGVVWGTLRKHVLQACADLGVVVEERAPDPSQRWRWREAFLTNALRGVQSLGRIECGEANVWGLPGWEHEFSAGSPGPVTAQLRRRVGELTPITDVRRLPRPQGRS